MKFKREAELELREQLKRQSQAFSDHLEDAIKTREMEIERAFSRKFDELLEAEKCRFKLQLAAVIGRLKGLDKAIKGSYFNTLRLSSDIYIRMCVCVC